ncbi:HNH endonuclease family [Trichomonas vaginalis G3]|uniref:HNH endonuclease family n=1 Tax=Trichomonas vaginalis (strain ATCC PRA-98 / G3) TaxID=412133 RepID=UPI0021E60607|nr:HNH endonuclease family [Trichomonas vaginalis G3]KAI5508617.1 HNH endonuclease family [Trichomonas vaginalis G3]
MEGEGHWQTLEHDNDYEIFSEYPYPIRRISNKRVVSEFDQGNGYICVNLNKHKLMKHRIVAETFIPNPEGLREVDHINRDRGDFHISNLRWTTRRENMRNISGSNGYWFDIVDSLPEDAVEIIQYSYHTLENYYYVPSEDVFYCFMGTQYRRMNVLRQYNKDYINITDVEGRRTKLFIAKFKRDNGYV